MPRSLIDQLSSYWTQITTAHAADEQRDRDNFVASQSVTWIETLLYLFQDI